VKKGVAKNVKKSRAEGVKSRVPRVMTPDVAYLQRNTNLGSSKTHTRTGTHDIHHVVDGLLNASATDVFPLHFLCRLM
jgi:hypothetical protein